MYDKPQMSVNKMKQLNNLLKIGNITNKKASSTCDTDESWVGWVEARPNMRAAFLWVINPKNYYVKLQMAIL